MPPSDRQLSAIRARRAQIISAARELAEEQGWDAVTTRRLAEAIGYSQPVLYGQFRGMQQIIDAVAIEGFASMAEELTAAADRAAGGGASGASGAADGSAASRADLPTDADRDAARLRAALTGYLTFAERHPAVFEAMFRRSRLTFGPDAGAQQRAAFEVLHRVIQPFAAAHGQDSETLTEVAWSAVHGLAELSRDQRLRPALAEHRLSLLVAALTGADAATRRVALS